ncbi:STAS domain-containing protein [Oceanirhabdus seepicola]|uniref:Anti-sigma factor antagonist n=1 Tax=Oceanirhabdus seepicola TaxID=2828781 RepID=A0A9J6P037_9CLOT|nr:STAS domain-containing protein [Oceanirhabdus seepicola]MCM1989473.1 STAS domain-containing protein [Oceanirhabdus seepicola]
MNEISIQIPENFEVDEAAKFREEVNVMIGKGEKHFVLNFNNCSFIDSTGLGVLVGIYKKCMELEGSFKLNSINPKVMKIFELTRLDKVFEIKK